MKIDCYGDDGFDGLRKKKSGCWAHREQVEPILNSLQLLKAEIAQLKDMLVEDGYKDCNVVFQKILKIEQLSAVQ